MRRAEAEKLIGSRISAWTAANGVYVGILEEVYGSPWRGKVLITGILEPAQHYERGSVCRRGFRTGERIEVGGSSIRPTEEEGNTSYLEVLRYAISVCRERYASSVHSPHAWVQKAFADAMEVVIEAEERRLKTGEWHLGKSRDALE